MKLGFICLNLPGHLNPMTALARHLQARNHEVVFLYSSSARFRTELTLFPIQVGRELPTLDLSFHLQPSVDAP
jgi:UDP:flavonoid glycosyltransferase YjiC (YdhE family)